MRDVGSEPSGLWQGRDLHLERPHSARMYDFYLGGKDNYQADREAASKVVAAFPAAFTCARENRSFMHRATRVLASHHGIRQFLDIGTGIPTPPNLHEIAQGLAPEARVVYVDNDPIVLAHAQALLASSAEGRTAYVDGDVTDPESILASAELTETLDLSRPVALSLNALLHFVPDDRDPYGIVDDLMAELPSGSALTISHCTPDFDPGTWAKVVQIYEAGGTPAQVRSKAEVERFFTGLKLLDPGVTVGHRWRPEEDGASLHLVSDPAVSDAAVSDAAVSDAEVSLWAGAALKP